MKVRDKVYVLRDGSASAPEEEEVFVQDMASMKHAHPHMVDIWADEPMYCDSCCPMC